jgi:hypothetical protein
MDTNLSWVGLKDDHFNRIGGVLQWSKTVYDNDTLTFIPDQVLPSLQKAWVSMVI